MEIVGYADANQKQDKKSPDGFQNAAILFLFRIFSIIIFCQ